MHETFKLDNNFYSVEDRNIYDTARRKPTALSVQNFARARFPGLLRKIFRGKTRLVQKLLARQI